MSGWRNTLLLVSLLLTAVSSVVLADLAPIQPLSTLPSFLPAFADLNPTSRISDAQGSVPWADLLSADPSLWQRGDSAAVDLAAVDLLRICVAGSPLGLPVGSLGSPSGLPICPCGSAGFGAALASTPEHINQLPPTPGGGTLALTGLMTLGGLQLGRSARTLKLGSTAQQFYQATHPDGVDHAVDLALDLSSLPASAILTPADHRPVIHQALRDFFVPRLLPQTVLTLTAPRCPPV